MGKFKNLIPGSTIMAPDIFSKKLVLKTTYLTNKQEDFLFELALKGVAICLIEEGFKEENLASAIVLFTKNGCFEHGLVKEDSILYGYKLSLIVYCIDAWRSIKANDTTILIILLEELIHHFWNTDDEVYVKEKSIKIMNQLIPERDFKLLDFFNRDYLNNELTRNGKKPRF